MAKKKKIVYHEKFESKKSNGKYTKLVDNMQDSEAWLDLSVYAKVLYIEMKRKYTVNKAGDDNKDDISYTYIDCKKRKLMSTERFTKSIDELINHGFIKITRPGRYGGNTKEKNACVLYGFSSQWQKYNTDDFNIKPRKIKVRAR